MKRNVLVTGLSILFIILVTMTHVASPDSSSGSKFLEIKVPEKGKNKLMFNLEQLNQLVSSFNIKEKNADIEFTSQDGVILAVLGKIKKSKVKWSHKTAGSFLMVKFKKDLYIGLPEIVKKQGAEPGLIIQVALNKKEMAQNQARGQKTKYNYSRTVLASRNITFVQSPDLLISMKYPIRVMPGQSIEKEVSVEIENTGTMTAKDFTVELIFSSDTTIPDQPATASENFKEDMLLTGKAIQVAALEPGRKQQLTITGPIMVPKDAAPGRYYVAAVIDVGNKIKEISEVNNKDVKFMMVFVPDPKRIILELPKTRLVYKPAKFDLSVVYNDTPICSGKEWRKCTIRPYLHQIKHAAWQDFLWEVDTVDRSIWQVKGIKFCKKGGQGKEVKVKMKVTGGSKTVPPSSFTIDFADARLEYEPRTSKFKITTCDNQIAYIPHWKCFRQDSHLYQIKHQLWADFYWEINTFHKKVRKIKGVFGKTGGTATPVEVVVKIE